MSYVIPAIEGEPSITWNGKVYWPVTQWKVASTSLENWLTCAVRFLMEDGATETSFHIVAQYAAWSTTGKVDTGNGYMLLRKLGSAIDGDTNDLGVKTAGSFVGGSASDFNKNQRQGYVYAAKLTGSKIWYDMPYFMTEAWTTANGSTAAGTVSDGVTVYSSNFYTGYSYWQNGKPVQVGISGSYTTPLCTYEITYNANGGSGTTATQIKTRGTNIALSANSFTRSNYHFVEWNTAADGTGTSYAEGATYTADAPIVLYAIWAINYILPTFSNVQLYRVGNQGNMDDYADYIEISFNYNFGGTKFSSGAVTVQYRQKGQSAWTNLTTWSESATISTRTGTWDALSYASSSSKTAFSTDVSWEFQIFLTETTTDSETYRSSIYNTVLTVALFPLDIYDGVSVAIGEPAPESLPTDGGGNTIVDGILTLGKAWDLDMPLDLTNTVDNDLNTAITNAGVSTAFHDTGDLSIKKLLTAILSNSGYTEQSGGTTLANFNSTGSDWPTTYACTKNGNTLYGCGWREIKWADGRLEKWVWGWQTASTTSTSAYLNNFWRELPMPPATSTPFIDAPNTLWTARATNTGAGVWVTQENDGSRYVGGSWSQSGWTDGSTITFAYSFYNNVNGLRPGSTKCLFQVHLDGHWK